MCLLRKVCVPGVLLFALAPFAAAQNPAKTVVKSNADLPRFSYPVSQPPSVLVLADDATFAPFLAKVDADVRSTLDGYDIQDKATQRELQSERLNAQLLTGDNAGALMTLQRLRTLQEKASSIATAGLLDQQVVEARQATNTTSGAAFETAFQQRFSAALDALPFQVSQERLKGMRQFFQIYTPTLAASGLKADADPAASRTGTVDLPTALTMVYDRVL